MRWQRQRRSKNVQDARTPSGLRKQQMDTDALFSSRLLSKAPASKMETDILDDIGNVIRTHDTWPSGRAAIRKSSEPPSRLSEKKPRLKKKK